MALQNHTYSDDRMEKNLEFELLLKSFTLPRNGYHPKRKGSSSNHQFSDFTIRKSGFSNQDSFVSL